MDSRLSQLEIDLPPVLDACCGSRMMWFDKADPRALFIDQRRETFENHDKANPGRAPCVVAPDILTDFTAMPFPDESFSVVVFDPPHVKASRTGVKGRFRKIYGVLPDDWQQMLRGGFSECFRVLRPHGVLIFKWAETSYPISAVLKLAPHPPMFGHRTAKWTHWYTFMKPATSHNRGIVKWP